MAEENKKVNHNQLEDYLRGLILEELRKRDVEVSESDARSIVHAIINDIDEMTAKRVKQHFIELAEYIIKKFKETS